MVEVGSLGDGNARVLTTDRARKSGSVDPRVQVSADEVRRDYHADNDSRYEQGSSFCHRQRVTSQMLLKKYQRQQEREWRRQKSRENESH